MFSLLCVLQTDRTKRFKHRKHSNSKCGIFVPIKKTKKRNFFCSFFFDLSKTCFHGCARRATESVVGSQVPVESALHAVRTDKCGEWWIKAINNSRRCGKHKTHVNCARRMRRQCGEVCVCMSLAHGGDIERTLCLQSNQWWPGDVKGIFAGFCSHANMFQLSQRLQTQCQVTCCRGINWINLMCFCIRL